MGRGWAWAADGRGSTPIGFGRVRSAVVAWLHRQGWAVDLGVLALFALLSLAMTYPLVCRLSTAVLGPPGDNFEYVWKLWWFRHALMDLHRSPFWVPDVFAPYGYPLALSETTVANTVLGLPLTIAFGEVASYNLLVLASFVLSGWAAYRLVRAWTGDGSAGLVAGAVFAFSPYRFAHLGAGHLPLLGTQWFPLVFLCAERLIRERHRWAAVGLGVSYALLALSSWYYAYLGALFLGLFVLWRARPWRAAWRDGVVARLALAVLVAGLLILPAVWPLLHLMAAGAMEHPFSLRTMDRWSASPLDFFLPSGLHPLWGAAILSRSGQNVHETLLGLGWVPLGLALYAWVKRRRLRQAPVGVLAGLGLVAFVLALGTTLHWAGRPVYVPLPQPLVRLFNRGMTVLVGRLALHRSSFYGLQSERAVVVPLPTLLLYLFVPLFSAMRVWARAGVIVNLAVATLAGIGVAIWRREKVRWSSGTLALIMAWICFEFLPAPYGFGWSEVRGQPVDEWLARQPRGLVAQFPLGRTWYGPPLYAQRVHGQPIAYGYGTFVPVESQVAQQVLATFPSEEALAQLRAWRVRYIIVAVGSYGAQWPEVRAALECRPDLHLVWTGADVPRYHGDRLLYLLPPDPVVPVTELVAGDLKPFLDDTLVVYELEQ